MIWPIDFLPGLLRGVAAPPQIIMMQSAQETFSEEYVGHGTNICTPVCVYN
jgi:hypothetical protein